MQKKCLGLHKYKNYKESTKKCKVIVTPNSSLELLEEGRGMIKSQRVTLGTSTMLVTCDFLNWTVVLWAVVFIYFVLNIAKNEHPYFGIYTTIKMD